MKRTIVIQQTPADMERDPFVARPVRRPVRRLYWAALGLLCAATVEVAAFVWILREVWP